MFSKSVEGDPARVLEAAREAGLEGIIAKQKGSRYLGGRAKTWLKIKCTNRQEFAIVGWLPLLKSRPLVGSLVLALMQEDERFHFAGKVGTGFDAKTRKELVDLLTRDASATAAGRGPAAVRWPRPLRHRQARGRGANSQNGRRQGTCATRAFRAYEGTRSQRTAVARTPHRSPVRRLKTLRPRERRRSIAQRLPELGFRTPIAFSIPPASARCLSPVITRPSALGCSATQRAAPCRSFVGRRASPMKREGSSCGTPAPGGPPELRRFSIQEKTKKGEYLVVETVAGLVALAQLDILEIHTWNSRVDDLERPDRLVFDLDPGPDVPWASVVVAAREIRARLCDVRLESWPKSTGGKGLHIVVPLAPSGSWAACLTFSRGFAQQLAADEPKRFVATMSKAAWQGRIFVDYLRNNRTGTSVEAYSMRARPGAPVSLPLAWEELKGSPPAGGLEATLDRLRSGGAEAWAGYWKAIQMLPQ